MKSSTLKILVVDDDLDIIEILKYNLNKSGYIVKSAKSIELMNKRLKYLIEGDSKENQFFKEYFSILLSYSANRVPEIADQFYQIDDAMRAGYFWDYGPFEYWDLIGLSEGIELIKKYIK